MTSDSRLNLAGMFASLRRWSSVLSAFVIRLSMLIAALFVGRTLAQAPAPAEPGSIAQGYVYLEPFEARVEVLYDLATVLKWLNQPSDAATSLPGDAQQSIRSQAGKLGSDWCRLTTDGTDAQGKLTSVALVKGKPGNTLPLQDGEEVKVKELMVGFVYEFSIPGGPSRLEVLFKPFLPPVTQLPVTFFFGSLSEQQTMAGMVPVARWTNNGRLPKPKPLAELPVIKPPAVYSIPLISAIWILFGIGLYSWVSYKDKKFPGGAIPFVAAWVIGIVMTWNMDITFNDPFAQRAPDIKSPAEAEAVLTPLLKNVYRAFDYRKESDIYDRLDHSVHGELLKKLYLQIIAALTLEGQDGTRTSVSELSVNVDTVQPQDGGFVADCQWTAMGTVGHWGHQHTRVNRYKARVTVLPVETEWKLTKIEVQEERRI